MPVGRVRWFNDKKGFGFIENQISNDIFVHYSSIQMHGYRILKENQEVEFEIREFKRGYQAIKVRIVKE